MELIYQKASLKDIDLLIEIRIQVLRAANGLTGEEDIKEVKKQSYQYYKQALKDGTAVAYFVLDGEQIAGTGGVSFYQVMPTYHNPSGRKAYIMNMYTRPEYRRQGIAYKTLDLLVKEARQRGITAISLEATEMGQPLYEKYGFVKLDSEMELPQ